jgi:hypothetical protein
MRKITKLGIVLAMLIISCNTVSNKFHMEKKYWDLEDYSSALSAIRYDIPADEKLPCLADEETSKIFEKLVDKQNILVVADDNSLGITHRAKFTSEMFNYFKSMHEAYDDIDKQDKFVYPMELVAIKDFGMFLQIYYFKLGNDEIIKNASNPEEPETITLLKSNSQTIVDNFQNQIDILVKEEAFSMDAMEKYSHAIDTNFAKLIATFPNANYSELSMSVDRILKKAKSSAIINSLSKLQGLLTEKLKK